MAMIDLNNLDKLTPEQKEQFNGLLQQFPHLEPKFKQSQDLNTPSRQELKEQGLLNDENELDYSNFLTPDSATETREISRKDIPSIKVDPSKRSLYTSFDNEEEKPKEKKRKERREEKREEKEDRNEFKIEGKPHPVLAKLRATIGLGRKDIATLKLGGCTYSVKALDRKTITQATALASMYVDDPILYTTAIEESIVAHAIVAIDGLPLTEIFNISKTKIENGKTVAKLQHEREAEASKQMFFEIRSLPNEITESLSVLYQQEFPPLQLLDSTKTRFLCPEAGCMQSRIELVTETCYCPRHGTQMVRENSLPNPSQAMR